MEKRRVSRLFAVMVIGNLFMLFFILSSCTTITQGTTQSIEFITTPNVDDFTLDGVEIYQETPTVLEIRRRGNHHITINKEGYEPETVLISYSFSKKWFWNLLFWPGAILDLVNGSCYDLTPERIDVKLEPTNLERQVSGLEEHVSKLSNREYPPLSEDTVVLLATKDIDQEYDEVAMIEVTLEGGGSVNGLNKALRKMARGFGANAVIKIEYDRLESTGLLSAIGVAVRTKE